MIDAAKAGTRSVDSAYLVKGTGRESLQLDTWTRTSAACPPTDRLSAYPSGTTNIMASLRHSGFASGEDVVSQWRLDGEVVSRGGVRMGQGVEAGGCYFSEVYYDRGLPDGTYLLELFGGPTLRALTTAQTTVGAVASDGSATLAGTVQDADSGRPVSGAVIYLLAPGTDLQAWFNDPDPSKIVSFAETGVRWRIPRPRPDCRSHLPGHGPGRRLRGRGRGDRADAGRRQHHASPIALTRVAP